MGILVFKIQSERERRRRDFIKGFGFGVEAKYKYYLYNVTSCIEEAANGSVKARIGPGL